MPVGSDRQRAYFSNLLQAAQVSAWRNTSSEEKRCVRKLLVHFGTGPSKETNPKTAKLELITFTCGHLSWLPTPLSKLPPSFPSCWVISNASTSSPAASTAILHTSEHNIRRFEQLHSRHTSLHTSLYCVTASVTASQPTICTVSRCLQVALHLHIKRLVPLSGPRLFLCDLKSQTSLHLRFARRLFRLSKAKIHPF